MPRFSAGLTDCLRARHKEKERLHFCSTKVIEWPAAGLSVHRWDPSSYWTSCLWWIVTLLIEDHKEEAGPCQDTPTLPHQPIVALQLPSILCTRRHSCHWSSSAWFFFCLCPSLHNLWLHTLVRLWQAATAFWPWSTSVPPRPGFSTALRHVCCVANEEESWGNFRVNCWNRTNAPPQQSYITKSKLYAHIKNAALSFLGTQVCVFHGCSGVQRNWKSIILSRYQSYFIVQCELESIQAATCHLWVNPGFVQSVPSVLLTEICPLRTLGWIFAYSWNIRHLTCLFTLSNNKWD